MMTATATPAPSYLRQTVNPSKTYKTRENALKALANATEGMERVHYVIAVNEEGRFFPVACGVEYLNLIHRGVAVVGG